MTTTLAPALQFGARQTASAETRRYIARCSAKGCKHVAAIDLPTRLEERFYSCLGQHGWQRQSTGFVRVVVESAKTAAYYTNPCPKHGTDRISLKAVEGRYSESRKCDVRCTSAIGHSCDCQCGGANHGSDHLG